MSSPQEPSSASQIPYPWPHSLGYSNLGRLRHYLNSVYLCSFIQNTSESLPCSSESLTFFPLSLIYYLTFHFIALDSNYNYAHCFPSKFTALAQDLLKSFWILNDFESLQSCLGAGTEVLMGLWSSSLTWVIIRSITSAYALLVMPTGHKFLYNCFPTE